MAEARLERLLLDQLKECGASVPALSGDPDFWFYVALKIAMDFVPGFKTQKLRRGRPAKWTSGELHSSLINAVKRLNMSELSACIYLAKNGTFKGSNAKTLYRELHRAKKRPRNTDLAEILASLPMWGSDAALVATASTTEDFATNSASVFTGLSLLMPVVKSAG
jgi:hypothetical protein